MIQTRRRRGGSDVVFLWLACALTFGAGWYVAIFRLGAAIDVQHELNHQATAMMRTNTDILAERPALERAQSTYNRALGPLDLGVDRATTVARFLRQCARIATNEHVRLVQVDQRLADALPARTAQSTTDPAFESVALDVTLEGSYRNILLTVRDLTQVPVAMSIEINALESASKSAAGAAPAELTARMHVSLQRLGDVTLAPATVTSPSEETRRARFR